VLLVELCKHAILANIFIRNWSPDGAL